MKRLLFLVIGVFLLASMGFAAPGTCDDGWCCACSRFTAECDHVVWYQYGSTTCPQQCPGIITIDCMGLATPPGVDPTSEATAWVPIKPYSVEACETPISDPPRSPRHTLTPAERNLVIDRLEAELATGVGPGDEQWEYQFTDVVLHAGVVTVTVTIVDVDAGMRYEKQTCTSGGFGSIRMLVRCAYRDCRLQKRFFSTMKECLEQYETGKVQLAGKPVSILD